MHSDTSLLFSVLSIIHVNDGIIDGRKRLQKSAYLLKKSGADGFWSIRFDFGVNGPFSREISAALHEAIITGLVDEHPGSDSTEDYDFTYRLTADGTTWLQSAQFSKDRCVGRTLRFLRKLPYDVLELSSTAIFIAEEVPSQDKQCALQVAIKRKPSLSNYEADAQRVLLRVNVPNKQKEMT